MSKFVTLFATMLALFLLLACGDERGRSSDGRQDGSYDANATDGAEVTDASLDTKADAAADAEVDGRVDGRVDGKVDAADDAALDAKVDAAPDATADGARENYYKGPPNQCLGLDFDRDAAALEASNSGGGCFASSGGDDEVFRTCVRDAVKTTDPDITDACGYCYGVAADCVTDFCVALCASDPSSAACRNCRCDAGCYAAFDLCTGFDTENDFCGS